MLIKNQIVVLSFPLQVVLSSFTLLLWICPLSSRICIILKIKPIISQILMSTFIHGFPILVLVILIVQILHVLILLSISWLFCRWTAQVSSRCKMTLVRLAWCSLKGRITRPVHLRLLRHCRLSCVILLIRGLVLHRLWLTCVGGRTHKLVNLILVRGQRVGNDWIVKS